MTDDEMLYAAGETIAQLEEYRGQLLERHRGKIVHAYGSKTFQVDDVVFEYGDLCLQGFVLKTDGTCGVRRYRVPIDGAEFVKS